MNITDEMLHAYFRVKCERVGAPLPTLEQVKAITPREYDEALAILSAVAPLIAARATEDVAAKFDVPGSLVGAQIATAIRALIKETSDDPR